MSDCDILIKNATIVEGTGKKAYKGSIGIVDERIATIGDAKGKSLKEIDAKGLLALPGFIDAHSHGDIALLWYPKCESYAMQGVTTFVGGMCGSWSAAPLGDLVKPPELLLAQLEKFDAYKYFPNKELYPLDQINEWMEELFGWTIDWKTMAGYFKKVQDVGISVNYAPMVGHGVIRFKVMGLDCERYATDTELKEMRGLIDEAMEDGCIGMTTGMDYEPDVFASHEEIIDGVNVLKKYNGVYCPHPLRTGRRRGPPPSPPIELITSYMNEVDIYKKTGVRLHLAHIEPAWNIYPQPTEELVEATVKATVDTITKESKEDLDITWDTIPWISPVSGLWHMRYLSSMLAPWIRELGSREALAKWLKVKDFREEVKEAIYKYKFYTSNYTSSFQNPKWADSNIVLKSKNPRLEGKSISEIAKERGTDPLDTYFDIIIEDPDTRVSHSRGIVKTWSNSLNLFYTHPKGMVGLDAWTFDDNFESAFYGIPGLVHYAGFPMIYTTLVRDQRILSLEEATQKTSTMAARVYNLKDRGVLREGSYADIVLMDLPNLKVLGDRLEPRRYPEGIEYVLVNGTLVVEKRNHTGVRPGKVLKRN